MPGDLVVWVHHQLLRGASRFDEFLGRSTSQGDPDLPKGERVIVEQKYECHSCGAIRTKKWDSEKFYNKRPPEVEEFPALLPCTRCSGTAYPHPYLEDDYL